MIRPIRVHLLPELFHPEESSEGTAVVIDVLRATTTIVVALQAGARQVIPCLTVEESLRVAGELPGGSVLLGGERGGLRIPGFDLGNSPADYTAEVVRGKSVVFTTTNGTRAMNRVQRMPRVLIGALVNLQAVVCRLADLSGPVHLVCAGTDGQLTLEDVLCAGLITRELVSQGEDWDVTDDATILALNLSETHGGTYDAVLAMLRSSRGGRNLIAQSFDSDIALAATTSIINLAPELHQAPNQIPPAILTSNP
ncbi:MAG: 2-phosphosulfolactate phosphatase [Planctomycetales bacterium]